jgi:hypothetical protein
MSVNDIVNKGSGSWPVITDNVPNPGLSSLWANAAPDVPDWESISPGKYASWTHSFRRTVPAKPGVIDETVTYDVEWKLRFAYGSQYKGGGLFVRSFWTEVPKCNVAPGFHISVDFQTGQPKNEGPADWPSALMGLQLNATIWTDKWKKTFDHWRYFLHANGTLEVA